MDFIKVLTNTDGLGIWLRLVPTKYSNSLLRLKRRSQ